MDVRQYLSALRKGWWLVVLCLGLALAVAAAVVVRTPKEYASTLTFFVTTSSNQSVTDAYQGGLFSQQRVKSYADLMTSERLVKAVIADQKLTLPVDKVAKRITAQVQPDTVLLQATVTDTSPARAQQIASGLRTAFVSLVQTLETPPDARAATVKVEVVAGPNLLPGPVAPKPLRDLGLAGLLGLLAGVGLALLRDRLDTSVTSLEALHELSGVPSLATITYDPGARRSPLLLDSAPHSARAESLRQLRTNLQFVDVDRPLHVVVVTSAVPDEGKSSTATNLAITLAESETTVLLLEGDLRRPRAAEYLGLEGAVGLTDVLVGQASLEDALQPWGENGLQVLPSGSIPPNPSELLASAGMARLLEQLRGRFDMVIIDSPPLLPVTDGAVLAAQADGAMLVVRYGSTSSDQVRAAVSALRAVDARVLGTTFTMVPPREDHAGGYGRGYYYGYPSLPTDGSGARTPNGRRALVLPAPARQSPNPQAAALVEAAPAVTPAPVPVPSGGGRAVGSRSDGSRSDGSRSDGSRSDGSRSKEAAREDSRAYADHSSRWGRLVRSR